MEPVCIAAVVVQAITWEKWDDPLLWVFLPSLDGELVKNLHLMRERGYFKTLRVYCFILKCNGINEQRKVRADRSFYLSDRKISALTGRKSGKRQIFTGAGDKQTSFRLIR